jgi:hypothetical protein
MTYPAAAARRTHRRAARRKIVVSKGVRHMRKIFFAVSVLLFLAVLAQFYFAAVGAFDRPRDDDSFALHSVTGMAVIPLLSVLATGAAALARAPGRLIGLSIAPFGLVLVQVLIIVVGDAVAGGGDADTGAGALVVLGLHAINALFLMGVTGQVMRRARALAAAASQPATAPVA